MGIRFVFGASGSGKSHYVYSKLIEKSVSGCCEGGLSKENFLLIVPDQFTMQTQKELVCMHPRGGIMNIDVLSFSRLCHRILEDVGGERVPTLDDTGKSLVLKKVADNLKDRLTAFGSQIGKQGYIHEVKSAISEFMQYGLSPREVDELAAFSQKKGALYYKLTDINILYRGFLEYIKDHFIATEETLEVACRLLKNTPFIKDSTVVFDGFTGFTPIQNHFIEELNLYTREIVITMTLGEGVNPYHVEGEQKLFYLTQKAVEALAGPCEKKQREETDIFLSFFDAQSHRFVDAPALKSLERNLFRTGIEPYEETQEQVHIFSAESPKDEVFRVGVLISELIRKEGYKYSEIGVIVSDMDSYASFIENSFAQMDIPCFLDQNRAITLNPMVEYIKSALKLLINDFSQETVMHYLRSGLCGLTFEEADILENYLLETGIRGKSRWLRSFTRKTRQMEKDEEKGEAFLKEINGYREKILDDLSVLFEDPKASVEVHVEHLYDYLVKAQVELRLHEMADDFELAGDLLRAREYRQVYGKIMELLEQIHDLLKGEVIGREEFYEILEAGIAEIEIGIIPQNVDRVLVGDMERTRMPQVKVMFCLGVNEGYIPKGTSKGGIISDMDREYLKDSGIELAPTPRQQMFIQRLYLYMNLTKPSHKLFVSYTKISNDGKALRPSYLIGTIKRIFPSLSELSFEEENLTGQLVTRNEGLMLMAEKLRSFACGVEETQKEDVYRLYGAYLQSDLRTLVEKMEEAAFFNYEGKSLGREIARLLYGNRIETSVSKMESYAACAYRFFMQYGLELKEREEFSFENADFGNIFHNVLHLFAGELVQDGYTWFDFPMEWEKKTIDKLMEQQAGKYRSGLLHDTKRFEYGIVRMSRILMRTVETLKHQISKGVFKPVSHEMSFQSIHSLDHLEIGLTEAEKVYLQGRIDRVDVAEDDTRVYVKIIDYKSGDKKFDLAAFYYGLQLQLVTYLGEAVQKNKELHPEKEIVPAAMLYYHINDPMVEDGASPEEINDMILKELRMKGIVNDDREVIEKLDSSFSEKSDVYPVEYKKDGSFGSNAKVMSREDIQELSDYATGRIMQFCGEILTGKIVKNPYERKEENACTYCSFCDVCGFDESLPGYQKRKLKEMDKEEIMESVRKENESWG